jgi:diguanylate cyclase (GGDEF)-like protein/PAS domain S-box-containing protein
LQKIRTSTFDCILSDNDLPDGSGFDLLDNLSLAERKKAPIIILTGGGNELTAVQALQKGAADYIPKGQLSLELLETSLSKAIRIHRLEMRSYEAEQALIKREAEISSILEAVPIIIIKLDAEENIIFANSAVSFLGYEPSQLIGEKICTLIGVNANKVLSAKIEEQGIDPRASTDIETAVNVCKVSELYKTKKTVQVLLDAKGLWSIPDTNISDQNIEKKFLGSLVLARNLTEQKKVENELRKSQRELKDSNIALKKITQMDGLTGVANRYCFDSFISNEIKRTTRDNTSISLIMIDIDFFKKYNDRYGHLTGDECLRKVANAMKDALHRPSDLLARYGGEEFVVTLPSSNKEGAYILAEKLRKSVENLKIEHRDSEPGKIVTISLGVFTASANEKNTAKAMIARADKALYQAKHNGRNCVAVEDMST